MYYQEFYKHGYLSEIMASKPAELKQKVANASPPATLCTLRVVVFLSCDQLPCPILPLHQFV